MLYTKHINKSWLHNQITTLKLDNYCITFLLYNSSMTRLCPAVLQGSCTKATVKTSSSPSSPLWSAPSWATGADAASPVPAVTVRPTATSFWLRWPWPAGPTAAFSSETSTTSDASFPRGTLPVSWSWGKRRKWIDASGIQSMIQLMILNSNFNAPWQPGIKIMWPENNTLTACVLIRGWVTHYRCSLMPRRNAYSHTSLFIIHKPSIKLVQPTSKTRCVYFSGLRDITLFSWRRYSQSSKQTF